MSTPSELARASQHAALGDVVTLFILDATVFGAPLLRFTPGTKDNAPVSFQGNVYTPVPVEATGFEWNGQSAPPRPQLRVANINHLLTGLVAEHEDLVGALVTRIRTLAKYLDGSPNADGVYWEPEIYSIERKTLQTNIHIEWELSSVLDQEGIMLPRRQVLRDTCTHRYRVWVGGGSGFDYSTATCPYTGSESFDELNQPTTPDKDRCSRQLSGCRARFGQNAVLPTRAFPGAARVRS